MDILFEAIFELILEGIFEASTNNKVTKPIRYILTILIALLYLLIIEIIFYFGITGLNKNLIAGIVLIAFGTLFLILTIIKFRKTYLNKMKNKLK